jgi:hypothetical protein
MFKSVAPGMQRRRGLIFIVCRHREALRSDRESALREHFSLHQDNLSKIELEQASNEQLYIIRR